MKLLNINPAKRKSLLVLPLIVLPGLCLIFFALGGGGGGVKAGLPAVLGLNANLPKASVEGRQLLNKKLQYEQAERDSLRKEQYRRQDPYRRDSGAAKFLGEGGRAEAFSALGAVGRSTRTTVGSSYSGAIGSQAPGAVGLVKAVIARDPLADSVMSQLQRLKQVLGQAGPAKMPQSPQALPQRSQMLSQMAAFPARAVGRMGVPGIGDDTVGDAKVGQLNALLDKVIRIRHPDEGRPAAASVHVDEVEPADSGVNAMAAVVADNQVLVAGMTVALRITDAIRANGSVLAAGEMVYGTVSINGDRLLVHIGALRCDRSLYTTDLQAYDLDGIAGIHIPGVLSRDVAKSSADQGVSSLNVLNVDPSLGAQAASAGIQTVKSFASRKVRQVRVSVPAGYQLLLRSAHPRVVGREISGHRMEGVAAGAIALPAAPNTMPSGKPISSCRNEGVELQLRGVWLIEGRMWFGVVYSNHSAIAYTPGYTRWFIRDRRQLRRTAVQELPLEPVCPPEVVTVAGDSVAYGWTGFVPFTLAKDKELVLEVGEKGGGRVLCLQMGYKTILNVKKGQP